MNNFTKEELENISDELEGTMHYVLRQKIQSMIDNYCEHEQAQWINVHEQLPENGQHVIAYCLNYPQNFVSMVRFESSINGCYFWNDAIDQKGNVTHWMPLQEPPL